MIFSLYFENYLFEMLTVVIVMKKWRINLNRKWFLAHPIVTSSQSKNFDRNTSSLF